MPIPLDTIEEYINEIQNNTTVLPVSKTIKDNISPQYDLKIIKKHKTNTNNDIKHAIRNFHECEEKVRQLERDKVNLCKDISMARRKNDNKALEKFNKELYNVRIDIEDAVYMRDRILNDIRKISGYDKFANIKCKFFSQASGCLNGNTCPYRH
jgi:hypothetical protein